jgi:hypothetical protein
MREAVVGAPQRPHPPAASLITWLDQVAAINT